MARPKPIILLSHSEKGSFKVTEILKSDAIFAVFFDGQPINLKYRDTMVRYPGPKYKKNSFSNSGHAFNLANKLNKMFNTDRFAVYKLKKGTRIYED